MAATASEPGTAIDVNGNPAPLNEDGNCFRRAVHFAYCIPLEKLPSPDPCGEDFWPVWDQWAKFNGLRFWTSDEFAPVCEERWIAVVDSTFYLPLGVDPQDNHTVVMGCDKFLFDPNALENNRAKYVMGSRDFSTDYMVSAVALIPASVEALPASGLQRFADPGEVDARRGPIRITAGTIDQRFAMYGIQGRDYVSGSPLVVRGPEMGTAGYSGSIVSHTNEVQTITQTGTITAGSFALSLDAVSATAANAVYNVGTAALDTYIETIPNIGSGGVTVSGGPLPGTAGTITFGGTLAGCNVSLLVPDNSGLTGGSYEIATVTPGTAGYVTAALYSTETTICDSGNLSLVGDYQMWARVYDNASTSDLYKSRLRAKWTVGDGSPQTNDWKTPQAVGDYSLVDLGQIHVDEVPAGTQRSKVYIEGKTSGTAGSTVRVVDLMFYPLETGFGEVRHVEAGAPLLTLSDSFTQSSGDYTGKSMDLGGVVSGGGDANDFTIDTSGDRLQRAATGDSSNAGRYVYAGSSVGSCAVEADVTFGDAYTGNRLGLLVRYVDSNNYAFVVFHFNGSVNEIRVYKKVGGSVSLVATGNAAFSPSFGLTYPITARVWSNGAYEVDAAYISLVASGSDSVFATSGALATGKSGIYDEQTDATANTRYYNNFAAYTLPTPTYAINQSRDLQFRTNEIIRADSTGTVYGTPFQNSQPFQPELTPEGSEGITNRLLIGTSRFNPDQASDPHPDAFTVEVLHTPVYLLGRDED